MWPDVGIKSSPFFQQFPKSRTSNIFENVQNSPKYLGRFWILISHQELIKVAQYGHAACRVLPSLVSTNDAKYRRRVGTDAFTYDVSPSMACFSWRLVWIPWQSGTRHYGNRHYGTRHYGTMTLLEGALKMLWQFGNWIFCNETLALEKSAPVVNLKNGQSS